MTLAKSLWLAIGTVAGDFDETDTAFCRYALSRCVCAEGVEVTLPETPMTNVPDEVPVAETPAGQ